MRQLSINTMTNQIVNTIDISYTAPDLPTPMVARRNLVLAIHQLFDSSTETVCVEGRPGYGKTILLREFAETCNSPCFSLFLKAGSRHSYDPMLARAEMANQIYWYLESRRLADDHEPTEVELRTLMNRCTRNLSRRKSNAFFIVDGLYHIPDDDDALLQAIMALLPFGIKRFRFLFSTDNSKNIFAYHKTMQVKPFVLTGFTSHESDEYLSDLMNDKALRTEHHNALGGVPALLASARRQILSLPSGEQTQSLSLPPDLNVFLEAEWQILAPLPETSELLLSYILAYGRPISTERLQKYTNISPERVEQLLEQFLFLSVSNNHGGWEFASEAFRQHAESKLRLKVRSATETIATSLLEDPDSEESLFLLPQYLQRIGNANKILDWFDEHRLAKILLKTRTPAWTEPVLRNAIVLSHDGRNDRALTTYSILRSLVPQITNITGIEHEIRARCVIGDISGALSVANAVPLLTQRLRLLAILVDSASESPGAEIQNIKKEVIDLVPQIDLDALPKDEAIDVAIDLYPVDPHTALNLLKSSVGDGGEGDSFEIAMARITVAALRSEQALDLSVTSDDSKPKTTEILIDERVGKFIEATQLLLEARSSAEIYSLVGTLEESSERIFILRKWISQHATENDILDVVERTITEAISAIDFTPTATFYREVLAPLPHASNIIQRAKIVSIVDAQKPVFQAKGPTIDYVRTQLLLAGSNISDREMNRAVHRLEDVYLECIDDVHALETKTACLAWCLGELERNDPTQYNNGLLEFRNLVEGEFNDAVHKIMESGAEQFLILKKALEPIALFLPQRAFELANLLNTAGRRHDALLHIVTVISNSKTERVDPTIISMIIEKLDTGPALDKALNVYCSHVVKNIPEDVHFVEVIEHFLTHLGRCTSATMKSECLGKIVNALCEIESDSDLLNRVTTSLLVEFSQITNPRSRYTVGCKLIVELHKSNPNLTNKIFQLFSEQNEVSRLGENVEKGNFYILDLLIKALCALARAGLLRDADVLRIRHMISSVHNPYLRVCLFSRLSFFFWREQEHTHFTTIVNEDVWNDLLLLENGDRELLFRAWANAYGVVWLENRDRARSVLSAYPKSVRIPAVNNLCFAILNKIPPGEPLDVRGKRPTAVLIYTDIHNLLALCGECSDDQIIYSTLEGIANQITHPDNAARFSKDQRAEVGRLMMDIAVKQLPTDDGIQHLGFQLISKAHALRVTVGTKGQWLDLITGAECMLNSADRVYVLMWLASYLPKKMKNERDRLLSISKIDIMTLESDEDRYQRFITLAEIATDIDRNLAVEATKNAFKLITGSDDRQNVSREKRIMDLAYSVDPELPMNLAVLYDDDPARDQYRERAKQQIGRHELKKQIGNYKQDIALRERKNEPNLAVAAWQSLGALNAGRMIAVDMTRIRDMLACASNYPLETSYPMYSWVLSNIMNKYSETPQASQYIRDVFEGLVRGASFFIEVTASSGKLEFNPKWLNRDEDEFHSIIHVGEREKGIQFLKKWLEKNADEFITIVDPYYGPKDLWLVRAVMETDPHLCVRIVTGHAEIETAILNQKSDAYRSEWRKICDQDPPYTEVLTVNYVESGKTPIHDRWILSKSAGVRVGTSFNSIGNKLTELSAMGTKDLERVVYNVEKYLSRSIREENGERIAYELFELLP